MREYVVHIYGREYTVQVVDMKIVGVACRCHFAMSDPRFIGDDGYLVRQLERALDLRHD